MNFDPPSTPPMETYGPQQSSLFTMDGLLFVLFRRKWLILIGAALGLAAAARLYLVTPRVYVSEAKLLVRYVTDSMSLDPTVQNERVRSPDTRGSNILNSEIEILTSHDLIEDVAESVGIERFITGDTAGLPTAQLATLMLLEGLTVDVPRSSNIIRLSYRARDPELAQHVLDELVDRYLDKHQEVHGAAGAYEYFSQQTDQLRSTLAEAEEELRTLKNEQGVVSIGDGKQKLVDRLATLVESFQQETASQAATAARIELLRTRMGIIKEAGDSPDQEGGNGAGDDLANIRQQLARLYAREAQLLNFYTRNSTPVKALRVQIEQAERQIAAHAPVMMATLTDDSSASFEKQLVLENAEYASVEARTRVLQQQIDGTREEIRKLNSSESRIVQLERKKELLDANYRYFSQSLERARIDSTLAPDQMSNINVVQPATQPILPQREGLRKRMAMALMGGVGVGAGLAFLLELLAGRSLRRPGEVERMLEIPSLMTLPRAPAFRRLFALNGHAPRKLLPTRGGTGNESDSHPEPSLSPSVDRYFEALYHRIEQTGVLTGSIPHLIGVTGCIEGSGTTTVATGLAATMSQQEGEKILLLEAGAGTGAAHQIQGFTRDSHENGMSSEGDGHSAKVCEGLYFRSADNGTVQHARTSLGRRFRDLITQLKHDKFSSVVLDMPPVDETSPTLQMAGLLDGVILVVESEKVSRDRARSAVKMLRDANANVIGVVFNKKQDYVPSWLDGSG